MCREIFCKMVLTPYDWLYYIVVGIQTGSGNSLLETGKEILYKTEFTSLRLCMITFDWAIGI